MGETLGFAGFGFGLGRACVCVQPPHGHLSFLFGEAFAVVGEVGEDEVGGECDDDGNGAL